MKAVRCKKCGDILKFEKILHKLQWCSCHTIAVDWVSYTEHFRILGNIDDYDNLDGE